MDRRSFLASPVAAMAVPKNYEKHVLLVVPGADQTTLANIRDAAEELLRGKNVKVLAVNFEVQVPVGELEVMSYDELLNTLEGMV